MTPKLKRLRLRAHRHWYRYAHGVSCPPTMLPKFGRGTYVDVIRRGPFIDISSKKDGGGTIRLIPYQPNHGLMVEMWFEGKLLWRTHLDYLALSKIGHLGGESA